jgi:hypothetical protein
MGYFWTAHMGHLWTISIKNWQRYKFYTFPISFKQEILFDSSYGPRENRQKVRFLKKQFSKLFIATQTFRVSSIFDQNFLSQLSQFLR